MIIRWQATVFYRSTNGTVDVQHDLEEIYDLHDRVEAGPHWDTIEKIEIMRVNHCESETMMLEDEAQ